MAKLPNKILIGVVDREDTYTGKLGFVTYPKSTKEPETPVSYKINIMNYHC
jgi:hypothetical protein